MRLLNAGQLHAVPAQYAHICMAAVPCWGADNGFLLQQIQPCAKRYVHDWVTCPFSHPGEKAKRRDPRYFVYTGIACPSMKKVGTTYHSQ